MSSIIVISGSHRINSQSEKISKYVSKELGSKGVRSDIVSLAANPIPLWVEEGLNDKHDELLQAWNPVSDQLRAADAFVVVAPEWAGMVTPGLKNLLLLATRGELSHKPALIISVSAGINGVYPITELRSTGYKNSKICFIPEHVIVRNVGDICNAEKATDPRDISTRERIDYSLDLLLAYSKALKEVRGAGIDLSKYPNGM